MKHEVVKHVFPLLLEVIEYDSTCCRNDINFLQRNDMYQYLFLSMYTEKNPELS